MSEPLNDFLEKVELHIANNLDNDAKLGRDIRALWMTFLETEKRMDEFCNSHLTRRFPVAVKISGRK